MKKNNEINDVEQNHFKIVYLIIIIISIILCFGALDKLPIKLWDESRLAINAIEMSQSDNWLVPTYEYEPDMWNTKPPLLIWLQAFLITLMGIHPIAIRLPIAIATFLTIHFLFRFIKKYTSNTILAFFTVMVLMTTVGYIAPHVSRTGDYDGLLILFTTLYSLSFFTFLENKKTKYLFLFFLFLAFAVLTKSIAALLFLPGIFFYTLYKKEGIHLLKNKYLYLYFGIFLLLISTYYLLREYYNPGYLEAVYTNEIAGRYLSSLEDNYQPFYFYLAYITGRNFLVWFIFLIIGIIIGCKSTDKKIKNISIFSTILTLSFLLIISSAKTKLLWYDAPIYPFFSILTAIALYSILKYLKIKWQSKISYSLLVALYSLIIFSYPLYDRMNTEVVKQNKYNYEEYKLSLFIRENFEQLNNTFLVSEAYIPHIMFYVYMANDKGISLSKKNKNQLNLHDKILVQEDEMKNFVEENFIYELIYDENGIKLYHILQEKKL